MIWNWAQHCAAQESKDRKYWSWVEFNSSPIFKIFGPENLVLGRTGTDPWVHTEQVGHYGSF